MESVNDNLTPIFRFSPSSILARTLSTLGKRPLFFLSLSFLAVVPPTLLNVLMPAEGMQGIMQFVSMVLGLFISGAITCAVYHLLQGEHISMGTALSRGLARALPLLGVSVLSGLGILIGCLLLLVPGIILMCIWSVSVPACVVERLGCIESMRRSAQLTKGYRMSIFGLILVVMLFNMVFTVGLAFALSLVLDDLLLLSVIVGIVLVVPMAFQYIMTAILYYDLRAAKEGISLQNLTSVFD